MDYYHLDNPVATPWHVVADAISQYKGANIPQVSFQDWLSKVRDFGDRDPEKVPAFRLLEFYENLEVFPVLDVANTKKVAPEVEYGQLEVDLIHKYLAYQGL